MKFVSEKISPQFVLVTVQVGVRSRGRPVRVVTATSRDCRPCIVLSRTAADEIGLSSSACTQRSIRRGGALASHLDPLTLSGYFHFRSKSLFLAVLNGTSIPDPEPVSCSCDPGNWAYG